MVECDVCHEMFTVGRGIKNHKLFKHGVDWRGPIVIKKHDELPVANVTNAQPAPEEAVITKGLLGETPVEKYIEVPAPRPETAVAASARSTGDSWLHVDVEVPKDVADKLMRYMFDREITKSQLPRLLGDVLGKHLENEGYK